MSKGREIKQRIQSVSKTKKITLAMKMVAAAKFKRSVDQLASSKLFQKHSKIVIDDLSKRLSADDLPKTMKKNLGQKTIYIIFSSDKGLCGGFNTYLIKSVLNELKSKNKQDTQLILFGNKINQFFKKTDWKINDDLSSESEVFNETKIKTVLEYITQKYTNNECASVKLIYNLFISAISNKQIVETLLPYQLNNWTENQDVTASDYIYESDKTTVLSELVKKLTSYKLFYARLNSVSSEEGCRMVAMDSASTNAAEVIDELKLLYNRSRQAAITTELTEIVAGATSLD